MSPKNTDELIIAYLSVCNKALALNKDRFPFKQILGAAQKTGKNRRIEVRVVGPAFTVSGKMSYIMTFKGDEIVAEPHGDCSDCQCDEVWNVNADYLNEVAENPDVYIKNPARINWEWLYGPTAG